MYKESIDFKKELLLVGEASYRYEYFFAITRMKAKVSVLTDQGETLHHATRG